MAGVIAFHADIKLDELAAIAALMDRDQQQVIYLRIARRSAIDGLTALSRFATERVTLVNVPVVADDDPRALLYATLANVATEPVERLQANLGTHRSGNCPQAISSCSKP